MVATVLFATFWLAESAEVIDSLESSNSDVFNLQGCFHSFLQETAMGSLLCKPTETFWYHIVYKFLLLYSNQLYHSEACVILSRVCARGGKKRGRGVRHLDKGGWKDLGVGANVTSSRQFVPVSYGDREEEKLPVVSSAEGHRVGKWVGTAGSSDCGMVSSRK